MRSPSRKACLAALVLARFALDAGAASAAPRVSTVAVFPVENLTATTIPGSDVRAFVIGRLASEGIRVLPEAPLGDFMTRHRVRYAAGIDPQTAEALRRETGADGVLIVSLELSSDAVPPKVGLFARLVSVADTPTVVWAEDSGLAGDDAPGFFDLRIENDHSVLMTRALNRTCDSLVAYLKTGAMRTRLKAASKFEPRTFYRAIELDPGKAYSVAIVPFVNLSDRRNAGEILALLFLRHLAVFPQFRVVETGVVRRQLLDARIIMDGGLSLSDAENVAALIDADFVLGGRVIRYEDHAGPGGRTRVEFSAVLIERTRRRVVWSSDSYNSGTDKVGFFERGITRTAHAMATQMVRRTVRLMAGER